MSAPRLTFVGNVRRGSVWCLETDHQKVEVYVSSTGRSLRFWDPKLKKELKP